MRRMAQQTGLSKSSVHRLTQAMERRGVHPASWWWETEEGRRWWTRLVVATPRSLRSQARRGERHDMCVLRSSAP